MPKSTPPPLTVIDMKMNFKQLYLVVQRLDEMIKLLGNTRERIAAQRQRLSGNSNMDTVITQLRIIENRLDEELIMATKMKAFLAKILSLYKDSEQRIKNVVENGLQPQKQFFINETKIYNETDFDWSIK